MQTLNLTTIRGACAYQLFQKMIRFLWLILAWNLSISLFQDDGLWCFLWPLCELNHNEMAENTALWYKTPKRGLQYLLFSLQLLWLPQSFALSSIFISFRIFRLNIFYWSNLFCPTSLIFCIHARSYKICVAM